MIILLLTIISVVCGFFSMIFHLIYTYYKKYKKEDIYKKISIFFRIFTLIFLGISMILVNFNLISDNHSSKTKNLKVINVLVILLPIAIIELLLSFV